MVADFVCLKSLKLNFEVHSKYVPLVLLIVTLYFLFSFTFYSVVFGQNCTMHTLFHFIFLIIFFCSSGIERLLLLLGEKPSSPNPSEGAACERVQQKAAVTLARLSRDPDVAQTAIQLKGIPFNLSHAGWEIL